MKNNNLSFGRLLNNIANNSNEPRLLNTTLYLRIGMLLLSLLLTGVFHYLKDKNICKYNFNNLCRKPDTSKEDISNYCDDAKVVNRGDISSAKNVNIMVFVIFVLFYVVYTIYIISRFTKGRAGLISYKLYGRNYNTYNIIDIILLILGLMLMIFWGKYYNNCFNLDYNCKLEFTPPEKEDDGNHTVEPYCKVHFNKDKIDQESAASSEQYNSVINTFILALLFAYVLIECIYLTRLSSNIYLVISHYVMGFVFVLSIILFLIYANKEKTYRAKIAIFSLAMLYLVICFIANNYN